MLGTMNYKGVKDTIIIKTASDHIHKNLFEIEDEEGEMHLVNETIFEREIACECNGNVLFLSNEYSSNDIKALNLSEDELEPANSMNYIYPQKLYDAVVSFINGKDKGLIIVHHPFGYTADVTIIQGNPKYPDRLPENPEEFKEIFEGVNTQKHLKAILNDDNEWEVSPLKF